jgi:hypothetical protein
MKGASIGIQVSIQLWPFKVTVYPTVKFVSGKSIEQNLQELKEIVKDIEGK